MAEPSETRTKIPASYRLIRSGLRAWLSLSRRSIRVLGTERLPDSAAILCVCHAADFRDALVIVAAFRRSLACVIDRSEMAGRQSIIESGLGMIAAPQDALSDAPAWHAALRSCTSVLSAGGLLLVFSESDSLGDKHGPGAALKLACEAWASAFPEYLPLVLPVHRFRPGARAHETMIHLGEPLRLDVDEDPGLLQKQVQVALGEVHNIFAFDPALLSRMMQEIERDLRERLQQQWSVQPGRKRKTDGFRLSPFAAETLRRVNRSDPEALVALTGKSNAAREAHREAALAQLRAEIEIKQLSGIQRVLGWAESVLGLPVALYGALNHLPAAFLLFVCGLWKRDSEPLLGPWIGRGVIVIGCYAGQVALLNHFLGRAAAGYYALTLPVSGAYFFRYAWLVRRRTRVLLAGPRGAMLEKLASRNRAQFFEELEAILSDNAAGPQPAREN